MFVQNFSIQKIMESTSNILLLFINYLLVYLITLLAAQILKQ